MGTNPNEVNQVNREPLIAGILSFFCIGLGQAYNGQRGKGYLILMSIFLVFFGSMVLLKVLHIPMPDAGKEATSVSPYSILPTVLFFLFWILNVIEAQNTAKKINKGEIIVTSTPGKSALKFIGVTVLSSLALILTPILIRILLLVFLRR